MNTKNIGKELPTVRPKCPNCQADGNCSHTESGGPSKYYDVFKFTCPVCGLSSQESIDAGDCIEGHTPALCPHCEKINFTTGYKIERWELYYWVQDLKRYFKEMHQEGSVIKLTHRGEVKRVDDEKCSKCGTVGLYRYENHANGYILDCIALEYCYGCREFQVINLRDSPSHFKHLLTMKKKYLKQYSGLPFPKEYESNWDHKCPECGSRLCRCDQDLGSIDSYYNTWIICTNPVCKWPGYYHETRDMYGQEQNEDFGF